MRCLLTLRVAVRKALQCLNIGVVPSLVHILLQPQTHQEALSTLSFKRDVYSAGFIMMACCTDRKTRQRNACEAV